MNELPLFPLNMVLFPGMPINLHVFEPRYINLMTECIEQKKPFGVVLIKNGREALGPLAEPYEVGCTARILKAEHLTGGRLNIVAVGGERFEILSLERHNEYLVGEVELMEASEDDIEQINNIGARLRPLVESYLSILADADMVQSDSYQLPNGPVELAYVGAYLLQISSIQKQTILEAPLGGEMLEDIYTYYLRELALLKHLMKGPTFSEGIEARLN